MSNKNRVHFFIAGSGDPELEKLLEKGLVEIGQGFDETYIDDAAPAALLDVLNDEQVFIVIKPV